MDIVADNLSEIGRAEHRPDGSLVLVGCHLGLAKFGATSA
jgi:hypothetical protein